MRYGSKDRASAANLAAFAAMTASAQQSAHTERERLIAKHMPLVVAVARRFTQVRMSSRRVTDEMVQDGLLGLTRAADGFDVNLGVQFSTYAWRSIWNEIQAGVIKTCKAPSTPGTEHDYCRLVNEPARDRTDEEVEATRRRAVSCLNAMSLRTAEIMELRYCRAHTMKELMSKYKRTKHAIQNAIYKGVAMARKHVR